MRLYRVILPVTDIERAAAFYGALLGYPGERVSPGRHYFACGEVILACFDPVSDGDGFESRPNQGHLYFAVADLVEAYARFQSTDGGELEGEISTMPWGERCFYGKDPFGNPICLVDDRTLFTGTS